MYPSLTPEERKEVLALSDLLIAKAPQKSHHLLFEAHAARTPILLDRSPPHLFSRGISGLYRALGKLFHMYKENPEEAIQEKMMSDLNLGLFVRSSKNFKSAIEELLYQPSQEIPPTPSFTQTVPILLEEMTKEALLHAKPPTNIELKMFTET